MEYTISDLILSTITVEAKISNINFKEKELIELLSLEDKSDIIKIGCNFNEYISDTYLELTKPVKKSNRGRKKKVKPLSNRKIQGNGKYFNSQITFTILDSIDKNKFYHLKLFTNGTIQIPFVCNENIEIIKPIINIIIKKIENLKNIKVDSDENIEIVYIKSIMRNYKFNLIEPEIYIDLYKFQSILLDYKNEQNDLDIYKLYNLELSLIKFFPERYTGIILKFKTPIPENQNKLTTVKIFSSGKMNIDGSNSLNESNNIKEIILYLLKKNKETILYTK
jgi:TATA-box binding protein (TBP) (component of TFIID and TFIIIB)